MYEDEDTDIEEITEADGDTDADGAVDENRTEKEEAEGTGKKEKESLMEEGGKDMEGYIDRITPDDIADFENKAAGKLYEEDSEEDRGRAAERKTPRSVPTVKEWRAKHKKGRKEEDIEYLENI